MDIPTLQAVLSNARMDAASLRTLRATATELEPSAAKPEREIEAQFPVYVLPTPLAKTLATWEKLHALLPQHGYYPVILDGMDDLVSHYQQWEYAASPPDNLQKAAQFDARQWFDKARERFSRFADESGDTTQLSRWQAMPVQPAANLRTRLNNALYSRADLTQYIGLVATPHSWEAPAYLNFGGWNSCPTPAEHVSMHCYWHDRYQQEILAVWRDTLICKPDVTLTDKAEALAVEQTFYCPFDVEQEIELLTHHADHLIINQTWYFWWD